jgi:DNA-binding NarL/FixJ family response regulator
MTGLLIVARVRFYREGLATLFDDLPGVEVVATAADAAQALAAIAAHRPDVALVAVEGDAGPTLVRAITGARAETRVVALGIAEDHPDVMLLAEAGVAGYVTSDAAGDEVVAIVERVGRGEAACPPRIAAALLDRVAMLARERREQEPGRLTGREREIVALIAHGLSNKQIAQSLTIEVTTVKNHVHNILEKLNVERRGEAAAAFRREI